MIDLLRALHDLEQIETSMAELYEGFIELFKDDADAVGLFTHLRMEELSHQNILKYESRIVRANPKAFRDLHCNLDMLDRTLESIGNFRQAHPKPTLEEALRAALLFEGGAAEMFYIILFRDAAREFAHFVPHLHASGWNHFDKLQKFCAGRGIAPHRGSAPPPFDEGRPTAPEAFAQAKG